MSKHRRAAKIDANQPEIVKALRKIPNVSVEVGHDDLLVGYQGRTYWFELKDPEKLFTKQGKTVQKEIKPSQRKLHSEFRGHYRIVWKIEQILEDIGISP